MDAEAAYFVYDPITNGFWKKTKRISLSPFPGLIIRETGQLNDDVAMWVCEVDNVVDDHEECGGCALNQCIIVMGPPLEMSFNAEDLPAVLESNGWAKANLPDGVPVNFVDFDTDEEG